MPASMFRYTTQNFIARGVKYAASGTSTYLFDLALIFLLTTHTTMSLGVAIAIGFLAGVTVNFFINYHWTFSGTAQTKPRGYVMYILLALLGATLISFGTTSLIEQFGLPLLAARTILAVCLGCAGFVINGTLNFRVL